MSNRNRSQQASWATTIVGIIDQISEWQGKISSFLILAATFQICYELMLRYAFNAPTTWGLEMTIYLCSATYVMSGAYAECHDAHIKVDIFYNRWSRRTQAVFDLIVTDVLFFFFCGVLVWYSGEWFWEAVTEGLTSGTIWDPPIWPMRLVLFVGAFLLLLSGCGKFIRDLTMAIQKKEIV